MILKTQQMQWRPPNDRNTMMRLMKPYLRRAGTNSCTIHYLGEHSSNQYRANKLSLCHSNKERNPDHSSLRNPLPLLVHLTLRSKLSRTFTPWTSGFHETD